MTIREAGPQDADLLAEFITELAEYEQLGRETAPDPEALRRDLMNTANPRIYALIAELDGVPVGTAIYYQAYSTNRTRWNLHLQDLFVREQYRGEGAGRALMQRLSEETQKHGASGIEFEVLRWNDAARAFYESLGAISEDGLLKMYIEEKF